MTWRSRAACRGGGTGDFFGTSLKANPSVVPSCCAECPVRTECREHGLRYEEFGTWGGRTQAELHAERRERGIRLPRF